MKDAFSTNRAKLLLSKGYFPKELPEIFVTSSFGEHASEIVEDWERSKIFQRTAVAIKGKGTTKAKKKGSGKLAGSYTYSIGDTESETFTKPKRGYERRTMAITHCLPQALLATEIAEGWHDLTKRISRQRYSIDRLEFSASSTRSLVDIDFKVHQARKDYIAATNNWVVSTDITRFYPTIYTHSIVWAAYGKGRAKDLLYTDRHKGSLADRLDLLTRKCNRNQTVGIPVGPETSRIIAELVSAAIEEEFRGLVKNLPNDTKIDRLQDDWFLGVASLTGAENLLSGLVSAYGVYGLEINGSKTSVDRVSQIKSHSWAAELAGFANNSNRAMTGSRLKDFVDAAARIQVENPSAPVYSFAISVLEGAKIGDNDIRSVESFLLLGAALAPQCLNRICSLFVNLHSETGKFSLVRIKERLIELILQNLEANNLYEVYWLLYTLRGLKIQVHSKDIAEASETTRGAILPLLLLSMESQGLFKSSLPKGSWSTLITRDSIYHDWTWLLGYEAFRNGWLPDTGSLLSGALFSPMNTRNIQFLDLSKNVGTSAAARRRRKLRLERSLNRMNLMFATLRGEQIAHPWDSFDDYE